MSKKEIRWDDSDSDSEDEYLPKASSFAPRSSMHDSNSDDDNDNVDNYGSGYGGKRGGGNRAPPPPQRNDYQSGPSQSSRQQHDYQNRQRPMGGGGRGSGQYHSGGSGRGGGGRGRGGGPGPMDYRDRYPQRLQQPPIDWKEQARIESSKKYKDVDLNDTQVWMKQRNIKQKEREMQHKKETEARRQKMAELKKEEKEAKRKRQQASLFGDAKPISGIIQRPPPSPPVHKDENGGDQSERHHTTYTAPMSTADGTTADRSESTVTSTVSSEAASSLASSLSGLRVGSSHIAPSSGRGHGSTRPRLKLAPRTKPVPKLEVDPHYLQGTKKEDDKEKEKNVEEGDNQGESSDVNPTKTDEKEIYENKKTKPEPESIKMDDIDVSKPSIELKDVEVKQQQIKSKPIDEVETKDQQDNEVNEHKRQTSESNTEKPTQVGTNNHEVGDSSETTQISVSDATSHPPPESTIQKDEGSTTSDSKRGTNSGKRNQKDTGRGRGRGGKRFHGGRRGGGRFHSNRSGSSGKCPKRGDTGASNDKDGDAPPSKSSLAIASASSNIDGKNVDAKVGSNAPKVAQEMKPSSKDTGDSSISSKTSSGGHAHGDYYQGRGGRGRGRGRGGRGRGNWRGGRGRGRGRGGRGHHGQSHNNSSGPSNKVGGSGGNQS